MKINEIIATNQLRQQEAKKLNVRAGETLFKVFSIAEITAWVMERLSGARRLAEIVNVEALRLPALDSESVRRVLTENPDKIIILGSEVAVEYRGIEYAPLVRIDFRGAQEKDWVKLPAEGIRLPGGREVSILSVVEGYGYYIEVTSSQFVPKVREIFNKQQWERFLASADKPTVIIPDPSNPEAQIPMVCEHQYGVCPATKSPLFAYATVIHTPLSHWSLERFETKWFGKREEAEVEHAKAVKAFEKKQAEAAEKVVKERAEATKKVLDNDSLTLRVGTSEGSGKVEGKNKGIYGKCAGQTPLEAIFNTLGI